MREAVQSLAAMNILQVRHGAGIFVSSLDLDALLTPMRFALELSEPTVDNLFEVRLALEPCAAELAAARASDDQVAGIVACAARIGGRGLADDELIEIDVELHRRIVDASQNELLINLVASLNVLSRRSRELTARIAGVTTRTRRDHRAIAAAIAARDPQGARDEMAEHLANVRTAVEKAHSRRARTAAA